MLSITAQRRIKEALHSRSPYAKVMYPSPADQVMVYHEESKQYEGPQILESYDGRKTAYVIVKDRGGRDLLQPYLIAVVKPALPETKPSSNPAQKEASSSESVEMKIVPLENSQSVEVQAPAVVAQASSPKRSLPRRSSRTRRHVSYFESDDEADTFPFYV